MPIFEGSRYAGSRYTAFVNSDGTVRKYIHPRVPLTLDDLKGDFRVVDKTAGDELDSIAVQNKGRERHWYAIAEVSGLGVNATTFPMDLDDGTELVVPSPTQFARLG